MGFFNAILKNICSKKDHPYSGYPDDLREYCEYRDKYQQTWLLAGEYTEKINYYYSNYINTQKEEYFNNLYIYCLKYIDLLPKLEEARREDSRINKTIYTEKPYCLPYHKLAMAYERAGCYNSAINVCNDALLKGYSDGTKGGYENRITKLKKKQAETRK